MSRTGDMALEQQVRDEMAREAGPDLAKDEWDALKIYRECADGGAFSVARLAKSSRLYKADLIEWCGDIWGGPHYRITDKGRAALKAAGLEP